MWLEIREEKFTTFINLEQVQYISKEGDKAIKIWYIGEDHGLNFDVSYEEVIEAIRKISGCENIVVEEHCIITEFGMAKNE